VVSDERDGPLLFFGGGDKERWVYSSEDRRWMIYAHRGSIGLEKDVGWAGDGGLHRDREGRS
jgi:hypothetical protein